ncbi:MAG TPA: Coenzyme F420 hydrogenase/dehydrogenase, beta subunit C-terminal domain [Anaerolineales bacterium]|nr:Coenzyme F420 hydrogenase/dehydrogenase, beta subunit C-terminal domain [Anaerolineales bacterium]
MNVSRIVEVHADDPLGALREFLASWWRADRLDALLAPVELPNGSGVRMQVIEDPSGLEAVNPYAPLMESNAATAIGKFSRDRPDGRLAAILRPCELRALTELRKRRHPPAAVDTVTIVGVDCLGTFNVEDYSECVRVHGQKRVTRQLLDHASEGDCSLRRLRAACRVCEWPAPRGADLTIGGIGVAPDDYLLVIAPDEATDERLGLAAVAPDLAEESQVVRREVAVGAVAKKRAKARAELMEALPLRFNDVGSLLAWLSRCTLCGDCLDACPLYDGELSGLLGGERPHAGGNALLAELVDVSRWLASCAGCGMCEQACTCDVPLTLVIAALSGRIRHELNYRSGDPAQRLPWTAA